MSLGSALRRSWIDLLILDLELLCYARLSSVQGLPLRTFSSLLRSWSIEQYDIDMQQLRAVNHVAFHRGSRALIIGGWSSGLSRSFLFLGIQLRFYGNHRLITIGERKRGFLNWGFGSGFFMPRVLQVVHQPMSLLYFRASFLGYAWLSC